MVRKAFRSGTTAAASVGAKAIVGGGRVSTVSSRDVLVEEGVVVCLKEGKTTPP